MDQTEMYVVRCDFDEEMLEIISHTHMEEAEETVQSHRRNGCNTHLIIVVPMHEWNKFMHYLDHIH